MRDEVYRINRTDEDLKVATARVHTVVSDRAVKKIVAGAFYKSSNLVKVTAHLVEEVGEDAFMRAYNLRHVTFSLDVVVKPKAFVLCFSLDVLAASIGFELDIRDRSGSGNYDTLTLPGRNDPTFGITRFVKWCNQMYDKEERYHTAMGMVKLSSMQDKSGSMRATIKHPITVLSIHLFGLSVATSIL